MTSEKKDGGPAFPATWYPTGGAPTQGMTLRDFFAAQALVALTPHQPSAYRRGLASSAYDIADAMLAERARRDGGGE